MRQELSSLDIFYLLKELNILIDGKLDKIYEKENKVIFQVYAKGAGKKYLNVFLPGFIFLSNEKEASFESGKFGLSLRKHLTNSRIKKVCQKEFERIIELETESKEKKYRLIIELFKPGNVLLCNESYKIIMAKEYKAFGSRLIRPGAVYDYPKKEFNFLELSEGMFTKLLAKSDKSSIVITLATELGLGGLYAEELCSLAGIDKKNIKLGTGEVKKLFEKSRKLISKENCAFIYYENGSVADITPIEIAHYSYTHEKASSFSDALSNYLVKKTQRESKIEQVSKYEKERKKLNEILKSQELKIKALESACSESQGKGEFIYEKYPELSRILEEFIKAKGSYEKDAFLSKIKNSKLIKDINEKEKRIVVEL